MSDDMAWLWGYGVVLVLCKIMRGYSDGTSKHGE